MCSGSGLRQTKRKELLTLDAKNAAATIIALGSYHNTELLRKNLRYSRAAVAVTLEFRLRRGTAALGPISVANLGA